MNRVQSEVKSELKKHKIQNFDIVEELGQISDNRLHLGIVCGRARDNFKRVMKLLESGLNVYVEKPCALHSKEIHEMVAYADQHSCVFILAMRFFLMIRLIH